MTIETNIPGPDEMPDRTPNEPEVYHGAGSVDEIEPMPAADEAVRVVVPGLSRTEFEDVKAYKPEVKAFSGIDELADSYSDTLGAVAILGEVKSGELSEKARGSFHGHASRFKELKDRLFGGISSAHSELIKGRLEQVSGEPANGLVDYARSLRARGRIEEADKMFAKSQDMNARLHANVGWHWKLLGGSKLREVINENTREDERRYRDTPVDFPMQRLIEAKAARKDGKLGPYMDILGKYGDNLNAHVAAGTMTEAQRTQLINEVHDFMERPDPPKQTSRMSRDEYLARRARIPTEEEADDDDDGSAVAAPRHKKPVRASR